MHLKANFLNQKMDNSDSNKKPLETEVCMHNTKKPWRQKFECTIVELSRPLKITTPALYNQLLLHNNNIIDIIFFQFIATHCIHAVPSLCGAMIQDCEIITPEACSVLCVYIQTLLNFLSPAFCQLNSQLKHKTGLCSYTAIAKKVYWLFKYLTWSLRFCRLLCLFMYYGYRVSVL